MKEMWHLPILGAAAIIWLGTGTPLRADQVEMQNGDRYVGKVVSLNASTLVVQNDVLGVVRIPKDKVAGITFGPVSAVSRPPASAAPAETAAAEKSAAPAK